MPKIKVRGEWIELGPKPSSATTGQVIDKNEAFVMKTAATWLVRLLSKLKKVDAPTIEFAEWILGPEFMSEAGVFLAATMEETQKRNLIDDLNECLMDRGGYGHTIWRAMQKVPRSLFDYFVSIIMEMIEERIAGLKYRGRSELEVNAEQMCKMFGLTELERDFLILLYVLRYVREAELFFDDHLHCLLLTRRKYLEIMLDADRKAISRALSGNMVQLGILDPQVTWPMLSDDFMPFLDASAPTITKKKLFTKIGKADVPLEHHFIDEKQVSFLRRLLSEKPDSSVHILLYGAPGTGKTCFAKALADSLKERSYEILHHSENKVELRRASIQACLNMTSGEDGSIILVDEADNLLNTRNSWFERGETQDKGWLNTLLEEPGARFIWVTNRIDDIEPSVLRRFCYSLHFRPFSRQQRIQLWTNIVKRHRVKRHFKHNEIEKLADQYKVSAGAIDLAIRKAKEIRTTAEAFHESVKLVLESHRTLLNDGMPVRSKDSMPADYSLEGLNMVGDINDLLAQLRAYSDSNMADHGINVLFHGPSGTGKSALARYIAHFLDRELVCKRASDLLSKWVGGTEQSIARAFAEAEAAEAVLVIDEADTFLFGRDRALRSYEISHTNEFLTQMENYHGILICTTNRLSDLDAASIRRFGHKIEFKNLDGHGNVAFYNKLLTGLCSQPLSEEAEHQLRKIEGLSPGDFETVRRNNALKPINQVAPEFLIEALKLEAEVKRNHQDRKIRGFMG